MAVFKTTYRVTWSDVDAARVVHHSNYFRLFQRAEEELYEHLGFGLGFGCFMDREIWLPRSRVYCQYRTPSSLGDTLEISLTINEIRQTSVKYGFEVRKKDGVLVAEGYVVAVAANRKTGKAIKIPSDIAEKLRAFEADDASDTH
jgi:YbgC/YbaW family acyl-CoA thioester hydrolase